VRAPCVTCTVCWPTTLPRQSRWGSTTATLCCTAHWRRHSTSCTTTWPELSVNARSGRTNVRPVASVRERVAHEVLPSGTLCTPETCCQAVYLLGFRARPTLYTDSSPGKNWTVWDLDAIFRLRPRNFPIMHVMRAGFIVLFFSPNSTVFDCSRSRRNAGDTDAGRASKWSSSSWSLRLFTTSVFFVG